jgi:hypothetical protein
MCQNVPFCHWIAPINPSMQLAIDLRCFYKHAMQGKYADTPLSSIILPLCSTPLCVSTGHRVLQSWISIGPYFIIPNDFFVFFSHLCREKFLLLMILISHWFICFLLSDASASSTNIEPCLRIGTSRFTFSTIILSQVLHQAFSSFSLIKLSKLLDRLASLTVPQPLISIHYVYTVVHTLKSGLTCAD